MNSDSTPLSTVFNGWDSYHTSIVHAIQPLTREQITWRPAPHLRSVGEVASHLALGRIEWFARMPAPGSIELAQKAAVAAVNAATNRQNAALAENRELMIEWLEASWQMIAITLNQWTVKDLARTYQHPYQGHIFEVSYQWTIWRILTHDIHHGGELALMLGMQNIQVPELGDLFGHLTMPPIVG